MKPIKKIGQPKINNTSFSQELEKIEEIIKSGDQNFELNIKKFSQCCYALDGMKDFLSEREILIFKKMALSYVPSSELKEFKVDLNKEDYNAELDLSILKFMLAHFEIVNECEIENLIDSYKVINKLTE